MNIDRALVSTTKGFLHEDEGRCLYDVALKASRLGPCLEIGSYCGKSAIYIGMACQQNSGILFSIDHHSGSEEQQPGQLYFDPELFDPKLHRVNTFCEFRKTIEKAGIADTVVAMVGRSDVAARDWTTPLSMVFIDGGHSFEAVLSDYSCWSPHIMAGGYLLIHDIFTDPSEGGQAPRRVFELALATGQFDALSMIRTLGVLQRRP
ncbi:MAG: class I SAM-dependent methyltransferase [Deltaproteobacteria bacterium]|nr:class I SAM-dependent methyltransferase [Deltaproteobacteria bacterium]